MRQTISSYFFPYKAASLKKEKAVWISSSSFILLRRLMLDFAMIRFCIKNLCGTNDPLPF